MRLIDQLTRAIKRFEESADDLRDPGDPMPGPSDYEHTRYARDDIARAAINLLAWSFNLSADQERVEAAYRNLALWVPQGKLPEGVDEDCPFLTEMNLYELLGKEDARTLLALVRHLAEAAGIPPERQREISRG